MNKQHIACPDISKAHTAFFLSKINETGPGDIKISRSLGKSKRLKISKELIVVFEQDVMCAPRYTCAGSIHPELEEAFDYLSCWADGFDQFEQITRGVCVMNDTTINPEYRDLAVGSSSNSIGLPPGYMCVTADNALGCAQALIHEMAHHKLRLMGIDEMKHSSAAFMNPENTTVHSFINSKTACSINAAFHDLYTYAHMLELDIRIYEKGLPAMQQDQMEQLLAKNAIRVGKGVSDLLPQLMPTAEWKPFIAAVENWCSALVKEAVEVLKSTSYRLYNLERVFE